MNCKQPCPGFVLGLLCSFPTTLTIAYTHTHIYIYIYIQIILKTTGLPLFWSYNDFSLVFLLVSSYEAVIDIEVDVGSQVPSIILINRFQGIFFFLDIVYVYLVLVY